MKYLFDRYFLGKMDGIEIMLQDSKHFSHLHSPSLNNDLAKNLRQQNNGLNVEF